MNERFERAASDPHRSWPYAPPREEPLRQPGAAYERRAPDSPGPSRREPRDRARDARRSRSVVRVVCGRIGYWLAIGVAGLTLTGLFYFIVFLLLMLFAW